MRVITRSHRGFKGMRAIWRVAWSMFPGVWHPSTDARCISYRLMKECGYAGVEYVRGPRPL
jgi:hypothetical protein